MRLGGQWLWGDAGHAERSTPLYHGAQGVRLGIQYYLDICNICHVNCPLIICIEFVMG